MFGASLTLLLALGSSACSAEKPRGVILISIDTLRADHLGCYGYAFPTSPEIDRFAAGGTVFLGARSHAPSTLLSHAAILTSRIPQHTGVSHVHQRRLAAAHITLAEAFAQHGWRTAAFTGGAQLAPEFGLDQGFKTYETFAADFDLVVDAFLHWFDAGGSGDPFFAFLHTYEVHHPYDPAPHLLELFDADYQGELPDAIEIKLLEEINWGGRALSPADLAHIVAAYDAEIRAVDEAFGRLLVELERRGLRDQVLIALSSDHGEEFGERGFVGWHALTLHEEMLAVPLILRGPGTPSGRRVDDTVRLIDLAPTLLTAVGLDSPKSFQGLALQDLFIGGPPADRPKISRVPRDRVVAYGEIERRAPFHAITKGRFKYYEGDLFDLKQDPGERLDVAARYPAIRAALAAEVAELTAAAASALAPPAAIEAETVRQLEALGYTD